MTLLEWYVARPDRGALWADALYVGAGAAVAGLLTWRTLGPEPAPTPG